MCVCVCLCACGVFHCHFNHCRLLKGNGSSPTPQQSLASGAWHMIESSKRRHGSIITLKKTTHGSPMNYHSDSLGCIHLLWWWYGLDISMIIRWYDDYSPIIHLYSPITVIGGSSGFGMWTKFSSPPHRLVRQTRGGPPVLSLLIKLWTVYIIYDKHPGAIDMT